MMVFMLHCAYNLEIFSTSISCKRENLALSHNFKLSSKLIGLGLEYMISRHISKVMFPLILPGMVYCIALYLDMEIPGIMHISLIHRTFSTAITHSFQYPQPVTNLGCLARLFMCDLIGSK